MFVPDPDMTDVGVSVGSTACMLKNGVSSEPLPPV